MNSINDFPLNADEKIRFQETLELLQQKHREKITIWGSEYMHLENKDKMTINRNNLRYYLCGALRGDLCNIMPNSIVTPCALIPFYAGNIRFQTLEDIWNNSLVLKAFRNFDPDKLTGACGSCEHKISCGGCRALAFLFNGDFYAEDPMCFKARRELAKCS